MTPQHFSRPGRFVHMLAVALVALGTCAARAGATVLVDGPQFVPPVPQHSFVYGCDAGIGCSLYDATASFQITYNSPLQPCGGGNASTDAGYWYVTACNSTVQVFRTTSRGPVLKQTLTTESGSANFDVAVARLTNLIAVSNLTTGASGPGRVDVFAGGATTPSYSLTAPGAAQGYEVTFDNTGNCYWHYRDASAADHLVEFPSCSGTATDLGIGYVAGIQFDGMQNLYYTSGNTLYRCTGTTNCAALVTGGASSSFGGFGFTKGFKALWFGDTATGTIYAIDPKSGRVKGASSIGAGVSPRFVSPGHGTESA